MGVSGGMDAHNGLNSVSEDNSGYWMFDSSHSQVAFSIKYLMFKHLHGGFSSFEGVLYLDSNDPLAAVMNISLDMTSIDTGDRIINSQLSKVFNSAEFPNASFTSSRISETGNPLVLDVHGDLTIKGTTKEEIFRVSLTNYDAVDSGFSEASAKASTRINRDDYGISWGSLMDVGGIGGFLIDDYVDINAHITAIRHDKEII